MEVRKINSINFGNKVKTVQLFETVLMRNFQSENITGYKEVMNSLYPDKGFVGCRGYRYYAQQIRDNVLQKYPQIAEDVKHINEFINSNPNVKNAQLSEFVQPYIKKYGEYVDITI